MQFHLTIYRHIASKHNQCNRGHFCEGSLTIQHKSVVITIKKELITNLIIHSKAKSNAVFIEEKFRQRIN